MCKSLIAKILASISVLITEISHIFRFRVVITLFRVRGSYIRVSIRDRVRGRVSYIYNNFQLNIICLCSATDIMVDDQSGEPGSIPTWGQIFFLYYIRVSVKTAPCAIASSKCEMTHSILAVCAA